MFGAVGDERGGEVTDIGAVAALAAALSHHFRVVFVEIGIGAELADSHAAA
jgi:hypothetical protein